MLIDDLLQFIDIAQSNSLTAAAQRLNLSPASISAKLLRLEKHFGVRLLVRSTRSQRLTAAGERLLSCAQNVKTELETIAHEYAKQDRELSGSLTVTAPNDSGRNFITHILDQFTEQYPQLNINFILTDKILDLITERIDVAIRFGPLTDSSLIARKLANNRRILVAAPHYLKKHGTPKHPSDLAKYALINTTQHPDLPCQWPLTHDNGTQVLINQPATFSSNDGECAKNWAIREKGIALKSQFDVKKELSNGKLVRILNNYFVSADAIYVVYPSKHYLPTQSKLFIDFLKLKFEEK